MIKNKFYKKRIRAGRINKLNMILENSAKIIPKKSAIAGFETFIPIFWRNDRYYIQNKIVPILMPPSLIWVLWSKTVPQHYLLHTTCWQKSTPTAYLAEDRCCDSVTGASHCTKYSCCRCIPLSTWCWSCPSCSLWPWCHNTHWSLCHAGTSSCSFIVLRRKSASSCIVVIQIQIQSSTQNSLYLCVPVEEIDNVVDACLAFYNESPDPLGHLLVVVDNLHQAQLFPFPPKHLF